MKRNPSNSKYEEKKKTKIKKNLPDLTGFLQSLLTEEKRLLLHFF